MLTMYTGVPGAGKTLFALWDISRRDDFSSRPFFVAGIKKLTAAGEAVLRPQYIEAADWVSVPDGSIVLIDEAQFPMPVRPAGQVPPDWISPLATHRHRGLDIYLTTQSPMLVDVFVRRLVGSHLHVNRVFGLRTVTVFRWESVQSDPNDYHAKKLSVVETRRYPKEAFAWYESATIHTHKRTVPKSKVLILFLALFGILGGGFLGFRVFRRVASPARVVGVVAPGGSAVVSAPVAPARARARAVPLFASSPAPVVSQSGYTVRGSIGGGGRLVYVAEDGSGDFLELTRCKRVSGVVFCDAGGRVVSVPSLAGGGTGEPVSLRPGRPVSFPGGAHG